MVCHLGRTPKCTAGTRGVCRSPENHATSCMRLLPVDMAHQTPNNHMMSKGKRSTWSRYRGAAQEHEDCVGVLGPMQCPIGLAVVPPVLHDQVPLQSVPPSLTRAMRPERRKCKHTSGWSMRDTRISSCLAISCTC